MTHFVCLVFGGDIERQLAPYDEGLYVEPHEHSEAGYNSPCTHNHEAQWDWYEIGGRWSGWLRLKDGRRADSALAGEIDWPQMPPPVAMVGEGAFQAVGVIGLFGYVDHSRDDEWDARFRSLVAGVPAETAVTVVDCHI